MNDKLIKKYRLFILLLACISAFYACSADNQNAVGTKSASVENETATEEITTTGYTYPQGADYDGYNLRILNTELIWNARNSIDFAEITGDIVDDAMYNRNRRVEERLNFTLSDIQKPFNDLKTIATTSILAGQDDYDIMYLQDNVVGEGSTDGYFYDLYTIDELSLDLEWWDQLVRENAEVGGKLYMMANDLSLFVLECSWITCFNKAMAADLGLENIYDLVRDGSWTFDKMEEMMKPAIRDINGDSKFDFDGGDIFGLVSFYYAADALIFGAGETYIADDVEGNPYFALDGERFNSVGTKLVSILNKKNGMFLDINEGNEKHSIPCFMNGMGLFFIGTIANTTRLREMETDYGLIPCAKFDEEQEKYHTWPGNNRIFFTIPVTNTDTSRTGVIADALSWESTYNVMPIYYEFNLEQKNIRDEDSIEMLSIIRNGRTFDRSRAFSWGQDAVNTVRDAILADKTDFTSIIARYNDAITKAINATIEKINVLS